MSAEASITAALFGRLSTLVLSPVHPIAWPNVSFTPPANHRFLRVAKVPTVTAATGLVVSGTQSYRGFLQVDVFGPIGTGLTTLEATAALVAAHFQSSPNIFHNAMRVQVFRSQLNGAVNSDPRLMIPVTVFYRALA